MPSFILSLALFAGSAWGQFPKSPTDLTVIRSSLDDNVKIEYKQSTLCETTPGVRSFSGFVKLPKSALYNLEFDFDINTYFLYFEARKNAQTAPLVIYLAGGPGESSAFTAMNGEGGPCYVNWDSNSTTLNRWSLNNEANVLYIDQPVGAGFSYTSLIKGTYDALTNEIKDLDDYKKEVPGSNATFGRGIYTKPIDWSTTNTTLSTAQALGHFAEHWLTQFPEYKSDNKRIGIWGNSAGGMWAPATAAQFDRIIKNASDESPLREWEVDNVGITNGFIDFGEAMPEYLEFASNNTYGQFLDDEIYGQAKNEYSKKGGCKDLTDQCHEAADQGDPLGRGANKTVNGMCVNATQACKGTFGIFQFQNKVSPFGIAVQAVDDFPGGDPCPYYFPVHTFLNQEWTQKELGVPLNFTYISTTVLNSFTLREPFETGTGGAVRTTKRDLEYLLDNGINVALVYGDRDSRCPWNGAEKIALTAEHSGRQEFNKAGYEYIRTNDTYNGGVVRQSGNLSFSRVFQAGHAVNAYQPETVERIFSRVISGKDVATGKEQAGRGYGTKGPLSSFYMVNETLPKTPGTCMVNGAFVSESLLSLISQDQDEGSGSGAGGDGTQGGGPTSDAVGMQVQFKQVFAILLTSVWFMYL